MIRTNRQFLSWTAIFVAGGLASTPLFPQSHPVDWTSSGGDPQRTGWEKSDTRITKENAKDIELLYSRKIADGSDKAFGLTPPVVVGLLISYRGFKELGMVANNSGSVTALDLDLNRVFWKRDFGAPGPKRAARGCGQLAYAMPTLVPPSSFGAPRPAAAKRKPTLPGNGFGQPRPVFALSADGKIHRLNTSNGEDMGAPLDFLPPGTKAYPLTIDDGTVYAVTRGHVCGAENGIYAIDLTSPNPAAVSVAWKGKVSPAMSEPAFGSDGTVYVHTGAGVASQAAGAFASSLLALHQDDLKLEARYTEDPSQIQKRNVTEAGPAPIVFTADNREFIVSISTDSRLVLHDAKSIGGADHRTALNVTSPLLAPRQTSGAGISGLCTWLDDSGARWIVAGVSGALNPELRIAGRRGEAPHGALIGFKLAGQANSPALQPVWMSPDMKAPVGPVTTGGVVFALATGGQSPASALGNAMLYALDGATGQELYTSGDQIPARGDMTGLTLANGRVFFATTDGTLYAFGIHLEI